MFFLIVGICFGGGWWYKFKSGPRVNHQWRNNNNRGAVGQLLGDYVSRWRGRRDLQSQVGDQDERAAGARREGSHLPSTRDGEPGDTLPIVLEFCFSIPS